MKLTQLIEVWEALTIHDTGDLGFCDLEAALEEAGVVIINDIPGNH